jgi:hypothetical protein
MPTVVIFAAVDGLGHNGSVLDEDDSANGAGHTAIALRR